MGTESPSLKQMMSSLITEVIWGRTHLKIAKAIRSADPAVIHTAQTFFGLTHDAHLDAAQMYAVKLHDRTREAVTVKSVLAEAERVAGTFSNGSAEEVRKVVAAAKAQLVGLDHTLSALEARRNEYLAHVDRNTILDPTSLNSRAALTINDLDDLLVETGNILNDISQLYDASLSVLELTDSEDYTTAFRLIAEAKCAQADRYEKEFKEKWPYERPASCR
jgi:hypothetical protein